MIIRIKYDIIAYADEKVFEECFESGGCIHGVEIVQLLSKKRGKLFVCEFDECESVHSIVDRIKTDLGVNTGYFATISLLEYTFCYGGERFFIEDDKALFINLLQKYLAPNGEDTITACILMSCDAGAVFTVNPLRFYVNSREAGKHHSPHVHVTDSGHNYNASISILTGIVIGGNLPSHLKKLAKTIILNNQDYFIQCWNTKTDGLRVDINHHFGFIDY